MSGLIKQTSILTISNILTRICGMVFFIVLARSLSVGDYGLFRYLLSLSVIYAMFFSGFPTALTKFVSENKSETGTVSEYTTNTVILMFIVLLGLTIPAALFHANYLYIILLLFAALVDALYLGFARGLLNYVKLAGFKLGENVMQLAVLLAFYLLYGQVTFAATVIFFSSSGLVSLVIFEAAKPEFKVNFKYSPAKSKQLIAFTLPVTLGAVGWTVMFGINPVLIKYFLGAEQVGYYSVGLTLVQIFSFLPDAISTITMPKVAGTKNRDMIPKYLALSAVGTGIISIIALIVLLIFKDWILTVLFTPKYIPALDVILPLSISAIFSGLGAIYASAWQGINRPGVPSIIVSIGAAVNLITGYFLIGQYGITGAAISLAVASIVSFLIIFIATFRLNFETAGRSTAEEGEAIAP